MTDKFTKILYVVFIFTFVVVFFGLGIGAILDKSVAQRVVKTVTTGVAENEDGTVSTTPTPSPTPTTNSTRGPGSAGTSTTGGNTSTSGTTSTPTPTSTQTSYASQLSSHSSASSCWVSLGGVVYDITAYLSKSHPGGNVITPYCGKSIDSVFGVHNTSGYNTLAAYKLPNQ